ncbi:I78 family peptidase inhibitor [Paracoccaceae bacterium Fryx2]|nr:I78 family peptidase inhibitor [Paracoccaceae bacterium Fryx2]
MFARPILAALALFVLAACVPATETPPTLPPAPSENACGAAALQGLVGQSARVLRTMKFAGPTRIIRPGMGVTMDYSPDRLNIEIDARERISRVSCG